MPASTVPMHGRDHCLGGADPIPCLIPPPEGGTWTQLVADPDLTGWWRLGDTFTFASTVSNAAVDSADFDANSPRSLDYVEGSSTGRASLDYPNPTLADDDDGAVQFTGNSTSMSRFEKVATTSPWDTTKFGLTGDEARTWICWFETPTPMATSAGYTSPLFGRWGMDGSGSFNLGWIVEINRDDNKLRWRLRSGIASEVLLESVVLAAGTWYFAAGTYDGTTYKLYLDGALADSETTGGGMADPNTPYWRIGAALYDSGVGSAMFSHQGVVDEVALYKRALTAGEIADLAGGGELDQTGWVPTVQDDGSVAWSAPTLLVNY